VQPVGLYSVLQLVFFEPVLQTILTESVLQTWHIDVYNACLLKPAQAPFKDVH
jgi:hypothetical protein